MLEFGKRYDWELLKKAYPGKYVFLSDVFVSKGVKTSGVLEGVCEIEDLDAATADILSRGVDCLPYLITEVYWSGILTCNWEDFKDMLEFGKRYDWELLKEIYPDKYVFLSDVEVVNGHLKSGVLQGVCDYGGKKRDEMSAHLIKTLGKVCIDYNTTDIPYNKY